MITEVGLRAGKEKTTRVDNDEGETMVSKAEGAEQKLSYKGQNLNVKPGEQHCKSVHRDTEAQKGSTSDLGERGSAEANQGNWCWNQ